MSVEGSHRDGRLRSPRSPSFYSAASGRLAVLHLVCELAARPEGRSAVQTYRGGHHANLPTDLRHLVWPDCPGPRAPAFPPLANRSRGTHGSPLGFLAWTTSRCRTQHLGAAPDTSHAPGGLMRFGCGLTSACSWPQRFLTNPAQRRHVMKFRSTNPGRRRCLWLFPDHFRGRIV